MHPAPTSTAPIAQSNNGLEHVSVADTVLSHVDGQKGQLILRGKSLDELAGKASYETMISLMLEGFVADLPSPQSLPKALGIARQEMFQLLADADKTLIELPLFDGVRALTTRLPDTNNVQDALALVAAPAVFTVGLVRMKSGLPLVAPDADSSHAADILTMCSGDEPHHSQTAALDRYLVTITDHGLNASTFTARVIASTGSGLMSCVVGALGALKGPLHGGAPGPVLDMLDAIGTADNAKPWLEATLAQRERIMGFGHRVYRVRDPRADALKDALDSVETHITDQAERLALAKHVESVALEVLALAKPDRALKTNVEFYTALLLEALGFSRDAFTCVFSMGRVTGWIAHAREQAQTGRLIRPSANYVGPLPEAKIGFS